MALKLFSRRQDTVERPGALPPGPHRGLEAADSLRGDENGLQQFVHQERYGRIVRERHRWAELARFNGVYQSALRIIDDRFGLVPEGFVALPQALNDRPGCPELDIETEPFLLARHPVTNEQFQKFVDAGAYDDLDLWPKDIWPHLIDFRDLTGYPGPRFWRHAAYDKRLADHPVVGVCYYEAAAYGQWAGYRLPTEAEWQMAASWRIRSSAHVMRRYPWGDALDTQRCNIWASGVGRTVPVTGYDSGAAPNGVLQLVGNVWEWTASDFQVADDQGRAVIGDMPLKGIRGGGFDTYFASQATSFFRTGLISLARTHNVGFRCALDANLG